MPAERTATSDQRIDREASHYDAVAQAERAALANDLAVHPDDLHDRAKPWLAYLDMPALTTRLLASLGDIRGRRVLDLGTGNGFLAAALAHRGAEVVAVDVSPAALDLARTRAEASRVADRIRFQLSSAEEISVPDRSVDAVCGLFVLHHTQLDVTARELARVMRPGAPGAFVETMAYNPVLSAARAMLPGRFGLTRASTDDEAPLSPAAMRRLGGAFAGTVAVEWPAVICFRMGGYIPALRHAVPAAMLRAADRVLGCLPGVGRASYFGLVTLRRSA